MNLKKIITIVLLLFVGVSIFTVVLQNVNKTDAVEAEQIEVDDSKPENRLVVYYLHGNVRCATCAKLESYSHKALMDNYSELLENGSIEFELKNYDEPENEHFLTDFDISYQALVVIDVKENAQVGFEKLEKIWDLTHDEEAYLTYVKERLDAHVGDVL